MWRTKNLHKYLKIALVFVFIMLVAVQAGKSFVLDEIDFPAVAHATSLSAKPIYYRGEALPLDVGTYHPTLYINSLALFVKFFGFNETTVRFFGVVCTLITTYLLVLILRRLIRKSETAETLLVGLFLLNPYTIANTTLPDIDSTVLPVVFLLFIYAAMRYLLPRKDMSNRVVVIMGGLFALALWSKLTTPLMLPPFLAILAIITSKDYRRSLLFTLKVTVVGAATFVITYFLYCKLLDLSTTYTYHFLVDSFTKGTNADGPIKGAINNLKNTRNFIFWPTLPVVGLLGISSLGIILDPKKDDKTKLRKLLLITSLIITVFYIALIAPFGGFFKYPFPVFGLLMLTIVLFYERYFRDLKLNRIYAFVATVAGFLIEKVVWKDSMFLNGKPFDGFILLVLIIVAGYVAIRLDKRRLAASLFVLSLFFAIGFQFSISRIQAIVPYPTKYHYGQMGLNQTTAYLRSNTSPNEVIWSMKDVGYYTNNKYIESYGYYFDPVLQNDLINLLKGSTVRYYVVSTGIGEDNVDYYPNIKLILDTYAVPVQHYGNFIIYKSKG